MKIKQQKIDIEGVALNKIGFGAPFRKICHDTGLFMKVDTGQKEPGTVYAVDLETGILVPLPKDLKVVVPKAAVVENVYD